MKNPPILRNPDSVSRVNINGSVAVVVFSGGEPKHYVLEKEDSTLYSLVDGSRGSDSIFGELSLIHEELSKTDFFIKLKNLIKIRVLVLGSKN